MGWPAALDHRAAAGKRGCDPGRIMSRPNKRKPPLPSFTEAEVAQYLDALEQQGKDARQCGDDRAGARVMSAYDVPPSNRLADAALEAAKAGDWRPLDDYIARGFPLPDVLRQYFRSLLPLARKPKRRPRLMSIQLRQLEIAAFIWKAEQSGSRAPVQQAAEHFGLSRSTIQKANAAFKKLDAEAQDFFLQVLAGKQPEPLAPLYSYEQAVARRGGA
jgi:hypothetical protein